MQNKGSSDSDIIRSLTDDNSVYTFVDIDEFEILE